MTGIARRDHSHAEITPGLRALSASLLLLSLRASAAAQVIGTTATVRGSVDDTSGGVLPGATVTLANSSTRA